MKLNFFILLGAILSVLSCNDYEETISYPAPDGKHIIDVTTELQLSNDPDPFWQHISLRSDSIIEPIVPGNLYRLPFYEKPIVTWLNKDSAIIIFSGNIGESFKKSDSPAKTIDQLKISIIIDSNK